MTDNVFLRRDVSKVCKYLQSKEDIGAIEDWNLNFLHVFKDPNFTIKGVGKEMWERVVLPELQRLIPVRSHYRKAYNGEAGIYTGKNEANP